VGAVLHPLGGGPQVPKERVGRTGTQISLGEMNITKRGGKATRGRNVWVFRLLCSEEKKTQTASEEDFENKMFT